MSLSSTSTLKAQIKSHLGPKADIYFATLNLFVTGQTSRTEFDDSIRTILDTPNLGISTRDVIIQNTANPSKPQSNCTTR
jgi:hypothetical protein